MHLVWTNSKLFVLLFLNFIATMIKRVTLLSILTLISLPLCAQMSPKRPSLVVNLIVSGMRPSDLERYQKNFDGGGLRTLYDDGLRFTDCQYSYQQTTTPVSLATLSTGAQPSTHGVVGLWWYDYVTNSKVDLILDSEVANLEYNSNNGGYSAARLVAPTLSDALLLDSPRSKALTIALDPSSAIILNGKSGEPYWFDARTCNWASSTAFIEELPAWIVEHNRTEQDILRVNEKWHNTLHPDLYINARYHSKKPSYNLGTELRATRKESRQERYARSHKIISSSPIGNDIIASFAKLAIVHNKLGSDEYTDMINICFDASRNVVELYGPESIEAEDMYYKLDHTLSDLIYFINKQLGAENVIYTLTSDHGTSSSYDTSSVEQNRFNALQFEVILNGFLSARYGSGNWVLSCSNKNIYLNHNTIYERGLSLKDVQDEAATFALQLDGVSQAITSTALRSSYFGNGYAHMIQNSYYPRRSGDVVLNLMPNWIEKSDERRSQSGSMYNYDRDIPFIIFGETIAAGVVARHVDAITIAPTIAAIMGVEEPSAAEGKPLEEIRNRVH